MNAELDFIISDGPGCRVLTWQDGGARPATEQECLMWDMLRAQYKADKAEGGSVAEAIESLQSAYRAAAKVSGSALLSGDVPKKHRAEQEEAVYRCACDVLIGIGSALYALGVMPSLDAAPEQSDKAEGK